MSKEREDLKPSDRFPSTALDIRERMRAATHTPHVRINRHPFIMGLTKPDFPLARYIAILQAYYPLYQAIETSIDAFLQRNAVAFEYVKKGPMLEADLRYFMVLPQTTSCVHSEAITSLGQLMGVLYAIEGSTLGGQVIYRSLSNNLGLAKDSGARFFYGYGDLTQGRWADYLTFIHSISVDETICQHAEASAIETFRRFESSLDHAASLIG